MNVADATTITNVALHKPATQSSISKWSSAQTVEADASVATNGDTGSPRFFHTDNEAEPWWQVDLGDSFVVKEVLIYNRRDCSERLRCFTVLASLTGEPDSWLPICRKDDYADFGHGNDIPLVLKSHGPSLARFVRVRKDEPGFLHFRECQVLGFAPHTNELLSLREEAERTRRRLVVEQAAVDCELAAGRTGHVTRIDERAIFVDTENYSTKMVGALIGGGYERHERTIAQSIFRTTDRALEIGTAIGVVTMAVAAIVAPANVFTYDANPAMVADARRNFAANRMVDIHAEIGVMRNRSRWVDSESQIDFFVSQDFWASRLAASPESSDITHVVRVPLVCLESKIAEHRANVLICDIEGGEADLLDGADLSSIRLIQMEIHYWAAGRRRIDDMIRFLVLSGFNVDFTHSGGSIVVLDRAV